MVFAGIELKRTLEDATIVQCGYVKNPIAFDTLERGMQVLLAAKSTTHSMLQTIIRSRAVKYNCRKLWRGKKAE